MICRRDSVLCSVALVGGESAAQVVGGEAGGAAHVACQMALMSEAGGGGDFGHGEAVLCDEVSCAFETTLNDVAVDGKPCGLTEEWLEVGGTESGDGGDLIEGEIFGQLIFDEGEDLFEPMAGERGGGELRRRGGRAVLCDETKVMARTEALGVEASGGMAFADLAVDGVGDELKLGVADLKAVANLDAGWILASLFGDGVDELFWEGEDEVAVVVIVRHPLAGGAGRMMSMSPWTAVPLYCFPSRRQERCAAGPMWIQSTVLLMPGRSREPMGSRRC